MTSNQLKYYFEVEFDSIANFSSPGFENSEISVFLSRSQENIYLDLIAPQLSQRSSATQDELNKIIIAELIRNTGEIVPSPHNAGPIGDELLSTSGWGSTGWTGSYPIFTHTVGNANQLTNSLAAVASTYYKIECTISGATAGTVTIAFGGQSTTIGSTRLFYITSTTTGSLIVTPTTDFDGSLIVSIKAVTVSTGFENLPNGQFVFLPENFFFPLTELANIQFTSGYYYNYGSPSFPKRSKEDVYVRPIGQLDYNLSVGSHIRKPDENTVWRMEYGRQTPTTTIDDTNKKVYELIGDGTYTITAYKATYYRRLIPIDLDGEITSELDPFIHLTIVRDAIRIAAASVKDTAKYQISMSESKQ